MIIQEVAPRDGLQIEPRFVPTPDKVALIDGLSDAGFSRIEAGSFVSPRHVPALADGEDVFASIKRRNSCIYVALVPNLRGAERAVASCADELNLVVSASETHNLANMRMTPEASFASFAAIPALGTRINGSIATAFGCPFEGRQSTSRVLGFVERHLQLGAQGVTLADTTGVANPAQVGELVRMALTLLSPDQLTLHFHDTRGLGLANVLAAYEAGAGRFDASLGGLGGCPFAPGATGNICTEDLVHLCEAMGIETGIDLDALLLLSRRLPDLVGHDVPGRVVKAGRWNDLHAKPAALAAA